MTSNLKKLDNSQVLSKVLFKMLLRGQNRHEIQKTKYGKYLLPFSNKKKP